MSIKRNILVRLASKIFGKQSVYKIHNNLLDKKFENFFYQIPSDARTNNEVLEALNSGGIAHTNLWKLSFTNEELAALYNEYNTWADKLDGFSNIKKFYEHKMNAERRTVLDQKSWLYKIASDEKIVKIAQAYFGNQGCSLFYADYWHTVPTDQERIASQVWHRDSEDSRLLKVFIYLNDVDENNGCLEFVSKTSNGLEYSNLEPRFRITKSVRATQATNEFITKNKQLLVKGIVKKNDVIFCDTTGFHRGGFIKEGNRKLINLIYVSNNCPHVYYLVKNKSKKMETINF